MKNKLMIFSVSLVLFLVGGGDVYAQPLSEGFLNIQIGDQNGGDPIVKLFMLSALLSMAPGMFLAMTPFTQIVIVFGMTRQALGTMNLPPNSVLIGLAMFISLYMMNPVITEVWEKAWVPLEENEMTTTEALKVAEKPIKEFILNNTYEKDLKLMISARGDDKPSNYEEVTMWAAVPAYMLTLIQKGLFIGMMVYWAFAFIDMIISAFLMYMGMMMLPPVMISLPFKVLIFIYIGGYSKITEVLFSTVV